ncbi:NADH:flavin oxidoreductase/NADH oxidase [Acidothermaceae bacterium B102]|nr:NADH:flavin oxidoreductase/NADH oxidase [Acidothermaceae bacterium B102]
MSLLFEPLTLGTTTFRNRAWVAAMCQYSSTDGAPNDWHLVHLGGLARGGAGLVITEATGVTPEGRISPWDAGIWNDEQVAGYQRITAFIKGQGAVPGIQLAHAGRKASTTRAWDAPGSVAIDDGGWETLAPSALAFGNYATPRAMTVAEIEDTVRAFGAAATRAAGAGFEVAEVHAAHGYLIHQFLSPLSNQRTDGYGGDFEGRTRLLLEVTAAVREAWPAGKPVFVRVSATDWVEGGWTAEETVEVCKRLSLLGVDLIDVSTAGLDPRQKIPVGPGYQVPFARMVREGSGLPVAAVGLITEALQAEQVLAEGSADAVLLARAVLRNPHWPLQAAHELGDDIAWPDQYERARP